jgi:hypothetical protein
MAADRVQFDDLVACVRNLKSNRLFVVIDDSRVDQYTLIAPDGVIRDLSSDLFGEEENHRLAEVLPEQRDAYRRWMTEEAERIQNASKNAGIVEYEYPRLTFIKQVIESLSENQIFRVRCRDGLFEFTRREFESDFQKVIHSKQYQNYGFYAYRTTPERAHYYRISRTAA